MNEQTNNPIYPNRNQNPPQPIPQMEMPPQQKSKVPSVIIAIIILLVIIAGGVFAYLKFT